MSEWYEQLIKPNWYPGDEIWFMVNQAWVPVFVLFTLVGLIGIYKAIKNEWSWYVLSPFLFNVLGVVLVPVMSFQIKTLVGGFLVLLVLLITAALQVWMVWRYSRVLALLCVPYIIWAIPIAVMYIELIRLNVI